MGQLDFGIEAEMMSQVVRSIKAACTQGVQVAIVVGGGNIFRGVQGSASGMNRTRADQMGMMATVMNGLALVDALERAGQTAQAFCAIEMPRVMQLFRRDEAIQALERGEVCVLLEVAIPIVSVWTHCTYPYMYLSCCLCPIPGCCHFLR